MRILYYFQEKETPMFQWQRIHIIDELQRHGCTVDCLNPLRYETPEQANEELLRTAIPDKYDLFFTNVCYEKVLYPSTVNIIKKRGIPTLCLRCDNLVIPYNDKVVAPHFDLVWLTAKETKYLYDKWKVKSFFAPYAANPYIFKANDNPKLIRKVCFIGRPYGSRSIMLNRLTTSGVATDVFCKSTPGNNSAGLSSELKSDLISPSRSFVISHRFLFPQGRKIMMGMILNKLKGQQTILENGNVTFLSSVRPELQGTFYSDYALALASTSTNHTDVLKNPLKIINLRNFEIPMSGGIEICKFNPELADYFEDGKEIIFYHNNDELVDKARYYTEKATDKEINDIKRMARKRAEAEHSWWNRFEMAFSILGIKV